MQPLHDLLAGAGRWQGTNRLHDPHTGAPGDSSSEATITPVLAGRFVRLDYDWRRQGTPQHGSILLGAEAGAITAHWIDTWHMGDRAMALEGKAPERGPLALRGSYPAPPGPDWGWRIEVAMEPAHTLRVAMFNIDPAGRETAAVEATYGRTTESDGTGATLGEIGQIAVTVSDVGTALPFYRDVLGLKHLFSPAPQLAFLAAGSVRIMLSTPQGAGKVGANSILYFKVRGIETVYQALTARGAAIERPPQLAARLPDHELWIGFVRDPDGNLVGILEEKRPG